MQKVQKTTFEMIKWGLGFKWNRIWDKDRSDLKLSETVTQSWKKRIEV